MADRMPVKIRQRRRIIKKLRKAQLDQQLQTGPVDHLIDFNDTLIPPGSMGLALSGGGIRSATICLGLLQSFARHRRLLDFDYLSTVSGGGYAGSFLRSLFVPIEERGLTPAGGGTARPAPPTAAEAEKTIRYVEDVLSSASKQELIEDPHNPGCRIRNPIWWLREHGRYLAPNGPTDFGYGVAYIARNWMAMIYTFTIAAMGAFLGLFILEQAVWTLAPDRFPIMRVPAVPLPFVISPLLVVLALPLFVSIAAGIGYWTTVSLPIGNSWGPEKQRSATGGPKKTRSATGRFLLQWLVLVLIACGAAAGLIWRSDVSGLTGPFFWRLSGRGFAFCLALELAATGLAIAGAIAGYTGWLISREHSNDIFTSELRRRLTKCCDVCNTALAIFFCLALIDSLALALKGPFADWVGAYHIPGVIGLLAPAAAWMITKLPQWFAGGTLTKWIGDHIWTVALIAGLLLFGAVAVLADFLIMGLAWGSDSIAVWRCPPNTPLLILGGMVITALLLLTGYSTGFINLSSLHGYYAGRLTRAYLGASNLRRLRQAVDLSGRPVTENDPKDYIDISLYQRTPGPGPIHLINVTLNETRSSNNSQINDRDRKGVPVVFSPVGIHVDEGRAKNQEWAQRSRSFFSWNALKNSKVESLSVGQLCAISGAAMSAGMGMRTTLGGALSFTFANIRLGYWWSIGRLFIDAYAELRKGRRAIGGFFRPFTGSYWYLLSEMRALYSRHAPYVYLSDGGHFENSATYELLRRKVPVIVTCDCGADPNFEFEDLENLVRKARIDLGLSVIAASPTRVQALFGTDGASAFLNGKDDDWRKAAKAAGGPGCALLLKVSSTVKTTAQKGFKTSSHEGYIIWLKPRLFEGVPPDVVSYGERNPGFPQQTTSDQFFDEAQWESYRSIGFCMGESLLRDTPEGIDALRYLIRPASPPQIAIPVTPYRPRR